MFGSIKSIVKTLINNIRKEKILQKELVEKINKLKKEKNAIILAHCYQNLEIDLVADYVGDSLGLSRIAAKTDAEIIVFAGVYFMAQTAKILSPNKTVLLPNMKSGCQMADMVSVQQVREFKAKYPNIPVVCYVNSTAEVKTECDICCTSANAIKIVKSLNAKKVLFIPDAYLADWVGKNCPEVEIIAYPGYCPTHLKITPNDILELKKQYPDAVVLIHPECHGEVIKLADFVGSTTQIMNYCKDSSKQTFIIGTEVGVLERLERDYQNKKFISANKRVVCPNMKYNSLEDILYVLEHGKGSENEILVDEAIRQKAILPIEKMI